MAQTHISKLSNELLHQIIREGSLNSLKNLDSLKSLSMTSKHFHAIALPFLFDTKTVQGDLYTIADHLAVLKDNAKLLTYTKSYRYSLNSTDDWTLHGAFNYVSQSLLRAFNQMVHLRKLHFSITGHPALRLYEPFSKTVVLPKVEILIVADGCEFIIASCPNVKTISSENCAWRIRAERYNLHQDHVWCNYRLIEAAAQAPKLTQFALSERWRPAVLRAVLATIPQLSTLCMEDSQYSQDARTMIPIVARFSNLRYLVISGDINVPGWKPPETWSTSPTSPTSPTFPSPKDVQVTPEVFEVVQRLVIACKRLEVLWVDDSRRVEVVRDINGNPTDLNWSNGKRERMCNDPDRR